MLVKFLSTFEASEGDFNVAKVSVRERQKEREGEKEKERERGLSD